MGNGIENAIIIAVILIIVVLGLLRAKKHFSGGGCCEIGSKTIRTHKELTEPVIGTRVLTVEGMTCENCQARVENAINHYNGVVCKVDLKKKTATVSFSRPVEDSLLKETVEKLGYTVTDIH